MPKPVKKTAAKSRATAGRRSSAAMARARQAMDDHLGKMDEGVWAEAESDNAPPHGDPFRASVRAYMSQIGKKDVKATGAKRIETPEKQQRGIALKAARERWAKKRD